MKAKIFFMVLLVLSATTTATVSIASNVYSPVLTSQTETVLFHADFRHVEPNGDPVPGGGGAPGLL